MHPVILQGANLYNSAAPFFLCCFYRFIIMSASIYLPVKYIFFLKFITF